MDCCVLSQEEVGRLQHYGINPNHEDHVHISAEEATAGLMDETYELVTAKSGRQYVTKTKLYFLQPIRSGGRGGIPVIQRVLMNQPSHIEPVRY